MDMEKKILEEMGKRAWSYTPEWRFDIENPDIGSALAMVFAEMTARTVEQFSKIPKKNRIAFFNALNTDCLPAVPARGYLQFSLINEEVPGVMVEAGTMVSAEEAKEDFKTCEDVYVTPAALSDIYQTCDREDIIYRIYDRQKTHFKPFSLFSLQNENLQAHEMYFSHDVLFYIQSEAVISLTGFDRGNRSPTPEYFHWLADGKQAVFEYYSEDGWLPFSSVQETEDGLDLYKGKEQKAFAKTALKGKERYWIRLRLLQFQVFRDLHPARMELSVKNRGEVPDTIYGGQKECSPSRFLPFGEQLSPYQEVYFGSEEIFSKRGAQITLSYRMEFQKIPLELYERPKTNWEWVMEPGQMPGETEYAISVESVLWEYYNGSGWSRLFADERGSTSFSLSEKAGGYYQTLSFICPQDMEKTLVNAVETYYIRARIVKINNLYKLTGYYLVPLIENMSLQYTYEAHRVKPEEYVFHNNMEYVAGPKGWAGPKMGCPPFVQTGENDMAMYLGFAGIPAGGPVKMLFCMAEDMDCSTRPLLWEYWDGTEWKNLRPEDETEHFSRTGIVTFSGTETMKNRRLFGKERCWLRIRDRERAYSPPEPERVPVIRGIYMNAVAVKNVSKQENMEVSMGRGMGKWGNLPPGTNWKVERSIGYIHTVENPEAMTGGCGGESPEEAMERTAGIIRHQNRAVSAADYEQLARCAARGIQMVKCFSGYDDTGKPVKGAVTLVVLPRQSGQQTAPFAPLRESIVEYMKGRISSTLADSKKFFVVCPELVEIRLRIECSAGKSCRPYQIKKEIEERLERFFCPWDYRSGQGWEIGSFPDIVQIRNAIIGISGIRYIRRMTMSACVSGDGCRREIDVEAVRRRKYILPVNGKHKILVNT